MRSGTNMIMQAAKNGGMPILYSETASAEMMEEYGRSDYQPQPAGFYMTDAELLPSLSPGAAAHALLNDVLGLHRQRGENYNVVYMMRDPREILASVKLLFNCPDTHLKIKDITEARRKWLDYLKRRRDVSVRAVNYVDVIESPVRELDRIEWPFQVEQAAAVVDPAWYRQRVA